MRNGSANAPDRVPLRLYSTQSFKSWLNFFLNIPGCEEELDASFAHVSPANGQMRDIWDSPAWHELQPYVSVSGNLIFTFWIDWFNPLSNRIAGKKISCGAIMCACLNLPIGLRRHTDYTFFVGITPGPREPSVTTLNNILRPFIDELLDLDEGCMFQTPRSFFGRRIRCRIIPALGDLVAIRKLTGFASHSATQFCSYCCLPRQEMASIAKDTWPPRSHEGVLKASNSWKTATLKRERTKILKSHGVRYSEIHRLTYRNAVRHNVLGIMHNWLEGILQHHLRKKWGIDTETAQLSATLPELADMDMLVGSLSQS